MICVIVGLLTGTFVYAQATQPFTINRGIYPGGNSVTMWFEDGTYFAKNSFGVVIYSGSDAAAVANDALSVGLDVYCAVEGGVLTESIVLSDGQSFYGNYYLDDDATYNAAFTVDDDFPAFVISGQSVKLGNLKLSAKSGNTEPLIEFDEDDMERHCVLENLGLLLYGNDGIYLGDTSSFWNTIRNVRGVNLGTSYAGWVIHGSDTQLGPGFILEQISSYKMGVVKITGTQVLTINGIETDLYATSTVQALYLSTCIGCTVIGVNIESSGDCPVDAVRLSNYVGTFTGRLYGLGDSGNTYYPIRFNSNSNVTISGTCFSTTRSNADWVTDGTVTLDYTTCRLSAGAP